MKKILFLSILLSVAFSAQAQQTIQCPVETVTASITTPLPSPWWSTPQQGNLVSTEVMMMGGQPTLFCKYWAYDKTVAVQRRAPEGVKNCIANGKVFVCN